MSKKALFYLAYKYFFVSLSPTRNSPKGYEGQIFIGKGRLRRNLRPSNLANSGLRRYATEASTSGVLYPVRLFSWAVAICHGVGYLELLILRQGMREPDGGMSEE